jgi:hypothetical protein
METQKFHVVKRIEHGDEASTALCGAQLHWQSDEFVVFNRGLNIEQPGLCAECRCEVVRLREMLISRTHIK